MKAIFKDDRKVYLIIDDKLREKSIDNPKNEDLSNIKHLDEVSIIYHVNIPELDDYLPVYYEYNNGIIIGISEIRGRYLVIQKLPNMKKDYTLINLNMLE